MSRCQSNGSSQTFVALVLVVHTVITRTATATRTNALSNIYVLLVQKIHEVIILINFKSIYICDKYTNSQGGYSIGNLHGWIFELDPAKVQDRFDEVHSVTRTGAGAFFDNAVHFIPVGSPYTHRRISRGPASSSCGRITIVAAAADASFEIKLDLVGSAVVKGLVIRFQATRVRWWRSLYFCAVASVDNLDAFNSLDRRYSLQSARLCATVRGSRSCLFIGWRMPIAFLLYKTFL